MKTFYDRFNEVFNHLDNSAIFTIYNEWAEEVRNELVYDMGEFNEIMAHFSPLDIALQVRYGKFNANCNYFTFDGYGNIESIENIEEWIEDYIYDMSSYWEDHADRFIELAEDAWDETEEEEEEEEEE